MSVRAVISGLGSDQGVRDNDEKEPYGELAERVGVVGSPQRMSPPQPPVQPLEPERMTLKTIEEGRRVYADPKIVLRPTNPGMCMLALVYDEEEQRLVVVSRSGGRFVETEVPVFEALYKMMHQRCADEDNSFDSGWLNQILSQYVNCQEFIDYLLKDGGISHLRLPALRALVKAAAAQGATLNLLQRDWEGVPLLTRYLQDPRLDQQLVRNLFKVDPTMLQRADILEELMHTQESEVMRLFLEVAKEENVSMTQRQELFVRVMFAEEPMAEEQMERLKTDIQQLTYAEQKIVYQLANAHSRVSVVRMMNDLGFKRQEPPMWRDSPSLFAANMDAAEMRDATLAYLREEGTQGNVVTRSFFQANFDQQRYILKNQKGSNHLGRKLGERHSRAKANQLGLKHLKIPRKIVVIEDEALPLTLTVIPDIADSARNQLECPKEAVRVSVYAEKVFQDRREAKPAAVSELLTWVKAAEFWDAHSENFILEEQGICPIDLEFGNFRSVGSKCFGELGDTFYEGEFRKMRDTVRTVLPSLDRAPFLERINGWAADWERNGDRLKEERRRALQKERAALRETGCLKGCTFTFSAEELVLNQVVVPTQNPKSSTCVIL
jgi:hypothetical protein